MTRSDERLIVFAKAPEPGRVKTRLELPPQTAARVHAAFASDVIERHACDGRSIVVWRAGDLEHPFWSGLSTELACQPDGPLGARMRSAMQVELMSSEKVIIVGTDSPSLPPEILDQAFAALDTHSVVLGPACDGGYYLIGARGDVPDIFPNDMPWGTEVVLNRTMALLLQHETPFALMPFWYDVDRPDDLSLLRNHLLAGQGIGPAPEQTRAILDELYSHD